MIGARKLGMSCKDVSRLVSEANDRPLSIGERLKVRLHVAMCRFCTRYQQQIDLLNRAIEKDKRGD